MDLPEKAWQKEQERVDAVEKVIAQKQAALSEKVSELKDSVVRLRKTFWEDVTVNLEELDDVIETEASIAQRAAVLSERERSHGHLSQQLKTLARLKDSPYFGRIDFIEEGSEETEPIYIGIASLMDEAEEDFLIYDWRAPIASMYYDYSPGPARYETLDGTIRGEMTLKRQFIIKKGKITGLFDTGVTIGDHMLQEVLGKAASTQMKSIVATIQKEQNQIIRNERAGVLVVQGAAGSGKTSAALQRIAYLLYAHRETLQPENIVLFSPNPLFNSYVSTVLPELGEENMEQTTYKEFVENQLAHDLAFEDAFQQTEMYLRPEDYKDYDLRMQAIQLKSDLAFKTFIDEYVDRLAKQGLIFKDIVFRGEILFSKEMLSTYFYEYNRSKPISVRLEYLTEKLLSELPKHMQKEWTKDWVDDEIELLDKEDYLRAFQQLKKRNHYTEASFNDIDREREFLARMVVKKAFRPIKKWIKELEFVDLLANYRQFYEKNDHVPEAVCRLSISQIDKKKLFWEDVTPFLYLTDRLKGRRINSNIRHLIIDEAQDYSPFQLAYLREAFPKSKMTLLGDINQGIYAHVLSTPSVLTGEVKLSERTETVTLLKSYRSTRPIVEFTKALIEKGDLIQPFNRDGAKPTIMFVRDKAALHKKIIETIKEMEARGRETIAIIGKTMEESRRIYEALKEDLSLRLMDEETYTFKKGRLVIPAYLAKGIEFDGVLLYDASKQGYFRETERQLLYTACTRAMHELYLFSIGELSPFLSTIDPSLYRIVNG